MRAGPCPLARFEGEFYRSQGRVACDIPADLHMEVGRSEGFVAYGISDQSPPHFIVERSETERAWTIPNPSE